MPNPEKPVFTVIFPNQITNQEEIDTLADKYIKEFFDNRQIHIDAGKSDINLLTHLLLIEQISKQRVLIGQLERTLIDTVANVNILANEHGYI